MEQVKNTRKVKTIKKKTNDDQEWCVYTDTDSITGDTVIRTKKFGKIFASTLFDEIEALDDTQIIHRNGRVFCFPQKIRSLYYKDKRGTDWGYIDYIERHTVKKAVYKIQLDSGNSVKVTADHSVMVLDEYDMIMEKKPEQLTEDDEFLVVNDSGEVEVASLLNVEELPLQKRDVYDIGMMDNPYVFFANDILVHNSVFYPAKPMVEVTKQGIDVEDEQAMTDEILHVASQVQTYLNRCYDHFAKRLLSIEDKHWFEIKQEMIARSGLWIRKKRYAQWIINDEGDPTDELDVKGLDIVRSDFPVAFRELLTDVIVSVLKGASKQEIDDKILDFRAGIRDLDLSEIARPTGVKKLDKYGTDEFGVKKKRTPVHVASALNYNDLIDYFDLKDTVAPIKDGAKIKWVYLKKNNLGFEKMAFKGHDDPEEIVKFLREYTNYPKIYQKGLKSKLESVYEAMNWDFPSENKRQAQKFFSM